MTKESMTYAVPLLVGAFVCFALGVIALRRRPAPAVTPFTALAVAGGWWSLWAAAELASEGVEWQMQWLRLEYLGITAVPVAWAAFASEYATGRTWPRRRALLLCIIPVVTVALAWTNHLHHLMWREIDLGAGPGLVVLSHGPWFWVHVAYSYALILYGSALMARTALASPNLYRLQTAATILAACIPWVVNLSYLVRSGTQGNVDLTPLGFAASGVLIGWSLLHLRLLEMLPIAHESILGCLEHGIVLLDHSDRVVTLNPAAEELLGVSERLAARRPFRDVLAGTPEIAALCGSDPGRFDLSLAGGEGLRYLELEITHLASWSGGRRGAVWVFRDVTEGRAAALALERSEERFRQLFQRSPVGLFEYGADMVLGACNDYFVSLLASSHEALWGLDLEKLNDPRVLPALRMALTGAPGEYEGEYTATTSGKRIYIRLITSPLYDDRGDLLGGMGIVEDITERVRAEQRTRELAGRLRTVVEMADELLACRTMEDLLRRAVELPRERLGLERTSLYLLEDGLVRGTFGTDMAGETVDERAVVDSGWWKRSVGPGELAPWEVHEERQVEYAGDEMAEVGHGWIVHTPIRSVSRISGVMFNDAAITGTPLAPEKQDVLAVYASLLGNIIARKQVEQAHLESVETAWTLLNATSDLALLLGADGQKAAVNQPLATALGLAPEHLHSVDIRQALAGVDSPEAHALAAGLQDRDDAWQEEVEHDSRLFRVSRHPIRDQDGRVARTAVFVTDLTERRRAEANQRLAALGQLAAGVAHEFNNILAIMSGREQIARLTGREDDFQMLAQSVESGVRRGSEICRNLTSFARPREPQRVSLPIETPLDSSLQMAAREIGNANVDVVRDYASAGYHVLVDPTQFEQVFLNLIINACHAMPRGGRLTASTRLGRDEGGRPEVIVSIADTGIGIPEENLPRIFEPFFTTKGSMGLSELPGSGLGLSVSLGIVEAHKGTICASSASGVGSTFTIRLEAVPATEAAQPVPAPAAREQAPARDRSGRRLLVAEDEDDIRLVVAELLRRQGHHVTEAATAPDALDAIDGDAFDLVITDLLMPGGGGEQIIDAATRTGARVIVVTGKSEDQLPEDLQARGASVCLRKPFRLDLLSETVQRLLRQPDA